MTFDEVMTALDCCVLNDPDGKHNCQHCPMCNYGAFVTNSCVNGLLASARQLLKTFAGMKDCRLCINSGKCDPGSGGGDDAISLLAGFSIMEFVGDKDETD